MMTIIFISGGLGIVWFILWTILVTSSPESHPRISKEELDYIIKERGKGGGGKVWSVFTFVWLESLTLMTLGLSTHFNHSS